MYIVTGGAGFIGSNIVHKLNQNGIDDILIVDNLSNSDKWKNLIGLKYDDYIHKDDFVKTYPLLKNTTIDALIHMGACSSTTEEDMDYLMNNNFKYSQELALLTQSLKIPFIYASSAATYGDGSFGFSDDNKTTFKLRPLNRYGYSKHLFDLWMLKNNIGGVGLKFFNVFGPNEYHKGDMSSVVYKLYNTISEGFPIYLYKSYNTYYKDGEQKRDFVYVEDCADIVWWFLQQPRFETPEIFNVGSGRARTWNALAEAVIYNMFSNTNIVYKDMPISMRKNYQYYTCSVMNKLFSYGYDGLLSSTNSDTYLEDSIEDYIEKYLTNKNKYLC